MTKRPPQDTRARILAAAEELSCKIGPAHISLDAVAARAGVSKGGLLYHFPAKHDLMRALVAAHVGEMRRSFEAESAQSFGPLDLARAYLRVMQAKLDEPTAPQGIFAAIAEDPEFVAPLREFRKAILADVFRRCPDSAVAIAVYFACEGLVHIRLTDPQADDAAERGRVFATLERLLDAPA